MRLRSSLGSRCASRLCAHAPPGQSYSSATERSMPEHGPSAGQTSTSFAHLLSHGDAVSAWDGAQAASQWQSRLMSSVLATLVRCY
jgi:hypothetical protein